MKGGYILVDCGGLELNDSSSQSITGLYKRAQAALKSGKPVLAGRQHDHHRDRSRFPRCHRE